MVKNSGKRKINEEQEKDSINEKDLPIIKINYILNIGNYIFELKKGERIPEEVDKNFYSSLRTEGIIE